jgi:hypothetical protein
MKRRVLAGQVVLNQLSQIAVEALVGDLLPGGKIQARLIEATAEALSILCDEPGHEAACHHGTDEEEPVKESADERHNPSRVVANAWSLPVREVATKRHRGATSR